MVGRPESVDALSSWTFDIRYASGIGLLVNTQAKRNRPTSVLKELVQETSYISGYTDGRKLPYEVTTIGARIVGVARPGTITCSCEEGDTVHLPAQVFWRDGAVTYHLYARGRGVTVTDLRAVATRILVGPPAPAAAPTTAGGHHPWWWAFGFSAVLVVLAVLLIRRAARPAPVRE
jgi:hypothetical protein